MSFNSLSKEWRFYGVDDFCDAANKKGICNVTISYSEKHRPEGGVYEFTFSGEGLRPAVTDVFVPAHHSIPSIPSNPAAPKPGETICHKNMVEELSYIKEVLNTLKNIPVVYDRSVPEKYIVLLKDC